MTAALLVRRYRSRVVHVVHPTRELLADGRLSFHDRPVCGMAGSWHPVPSLVRYRLCGRCSKVLQRPRPARLAAIVEAGRDRLDRAEFLGLIDGWSDPKTLGQVRGALLTLGLAGRGPSNPFPAAFASASARLLPRGPGSAVQCRHRRCPSTGCTRPAQPGRAA